MSAALTPAKIAFDAWWLAQTRMGDPARRPHLTSEAFGAGYHAALAAHPERDERRLALHGNVVLGAIETSEADTTLSFSALEQLP
jgi:hypothetical protein